MIAGVLRLHSSISATKDKEKKKVYPKKSAISKLCLWHFATRKFFTVHEFLWMFINLLICSFLFQAASQKLQVSLSFFNYFTSTLNFNFNIQQSGILLTFGKKYFRKWNVLSCYSFFISIKGLITELSRPGFSIKT